MRNCSVLRSKRRHAGLIHQADPDEAILVHFEIERALGMIGLLHRNREIRHLAGLRVELGEELLAEVRIPDHAVGIDDHVVGLNLLSGQIIFGDDDARSAAGRTRRHLEVEAVLGLAAEIERRKIVGDALRRGRIDGGAAVIAVEALRLHVRGAGIIAAHALEHLEEFRAGVLGFKNPLNGMAIRAVEQRALQLFRTGRARQPLRIRQLIGGHRRGLELEVSRGGLGGREFDQARTVERIARGLDRQLITAWLQASRGESVLALGIAHDRHGDRRAFLFGADQDALHRALRI